MATLKTVNGTVTRADGSVTPGTVKIRLSQQCTLPTGEIVPDEVDATVNATTGAWTVQLYSTNDLTPTGTYYQVIEPTGATWTIQVPQTAGPFLMVNLTTSTPTASPTPNHVTTLTVDGQANFTAGPVILGTDPGGAQLLRVGGTGHISGLLTLDAGITVTGAVSFPVVSTAVSVTLGAASAIVLVTATGQTITLPAATLGRRITVKSTGAFTTTIVPPSGTIDGAASQVLNSPYASLDLVSDGANWFIV